MTSFIKKKHVIPAIAGIALLLGLTALIFPFLPIGWPLIAVSALILMPYSKRAKKGFGWISEKDSTGYIKKIADWVIEFYHWADEHQKANSIDETVNGD